jgi:hypothetical protein
VFVVDDLDTSATFLATHVANIARATVPPDRVEDVHAFVGRVPDYFLGRPTVKGAEEYDALSAITLADLPRSARPLRRPRVRSRSGSLHRSPPACLDRWGVERRPRPRPLPSLPGELRASAPWPIAARPWRSWPCLADRAGWASWTFGDPVATAASAPAFGVATLTIVALALERIGVPLTGSWGPTIACVLAGLGGYGLRFLQGKARVDPSSQIDQ